MESFMTPFVPPPPPSGVVVPSPTPEMLAVQPVSVPAASNAAAAAAAGEVRPGGVALDMSNLFGPPKNVAKQSLPPCLRKKLVTSNSGASPSAATATPPPEVVATASKSPPASAATRPALAAGLPNTLVDQRSVEVNNPSLSSLPSAADVLPQPVVNAPVAVMRKSLPIESLITSPLPSALLPNASGMGSVATAALSAPPLPLDSVSLPPPGRPVVEAVPSLADSTAAPLPLGSSAASPVPRTTTDALTPLPAPVSSATGASALPPPAPVGQSPPVAEAAKPQGTVQSTQPTSSSAAIKATAHTEQEPVCGPRPPLPPPAFSLIAPHVIFQGKEQQVVVPPLAPVPWREKKLPGAAVGSAGTWYNRYDLQPSPSSVFAQHYGSGPLVTPTTRQQWTSNAVINSAKAKSNWRETYWRHVDVHCYVARRYFGAPPPLEQ
ncbi:hypothetical protein LSCM1_02615 [Leishmania martiniquensis]|uniref:Uncharacterized protein n=1 Tax=Leishmania martiniquensis TaxID=1580590 RepID=A0A836GT06_9TRYP|nr:hypothetical protein LSCM1_02615 [Leishmania martiniquensis]